MNSLIQATANEVTKRMLAGHEKIEQLTAEVKELLAQLKKHTGTDVWSAADLPPVIPSIERDPTQQPSRATLEWKYVYAPIRGYSDDVREHTYIPSRDVAEEEDDGVEADAEDDPSTSRESTEEHEEDEVVLPSVESRSVSKSECTAPSISTWRKRKRRDDKRNTCAITTTSGTKKRPRREQKENAGKQGRKMKGSTRNPIVIVVSDDEGKRNQEDGQHQAAAGEENEKQSKKETPVVNPYLEKIAQERARLQALMAQSGRLGQAERGGGRGHANVSTKRKPG
ncbi:hypothetical protein L209DRAFT_364975 [Thermothelomyces heterothallicus CBS 203.75]